MLYSKAREIYETKIKEAVLQFATTMRWTNDWEYSKNHKKPLVTRKAHMLVLIDREQIKAREALQNHKKAAFEWFMDNTAPETKKAVSAWFSGKNCERSFFQLFTRLFFRGTITLSTTEEQKMKKIVKAIWNVVIILIVLSIFPIVLMIDVLNVYFGFM